MKNHFIMSYTGNKRNEVEEIYNVFKQQNNVQNIYELYCGSSALSFYISTQEPLKYTYYLNDLCSDLIELYETIKDTNKFNIFINELRTICVNMTKEKYLTYTKSKTFIGWFIKNKFHAQVTGLYKSITNEQYTCLIDKMLICPIINFLRTENINFMNRTAIPLYEEIKHDPTNFIFLDPPYITTDNSSYSHAHCNIYEHLFYHKIHDEEALIILALEYNWITQLIFPNEKHLYEKNYAITKRKTQHVIIKNK